MYLIIPVTFLVMRTHIITLLILLLAGLNGFSQGKNPYGLPVVTTRQELNRLSEKDPEWQLVDLKKMMPGLQSRIWYATPLNFTGKVLYRKPGLYLRYAAARRLKQVQDSLKNMGLCLLVFDAYRPYSVTLDMWKIVPDDRYAANPAKGSGHNRGIAVDLTLADLNSGQPLPMPTGYDNFTDSAHHSFIHPDSVIMSNKALLKGVMEHFGFRPLDTEWWHYALPEPARYPLMDIPFETLRKWGY